MGTRPPRRTGEKTRGCIGQWLSARRIQSAVRRCSIDNRVFCHEHEGNKGGCAGHSRGRDRGRGKVPSRGFGLEIDSGRMWAAAHEPVDPGVHGSPSLNKSRTHRTLRRTFFFLSPPLPPRRDCVSVVPFLRVHCQSIASRFQDGYILAYLRQPKRLGCLSNRYPALHPSHLRGVRFASPRKPSTPSLHASRDRMGLTMGLRKAARIILIGAPGVGKGTQTERLLRRFPQMSALSSGDLLRENVRNRTPLGAYNAIFTV